MSWFSWPVVPMINAASVNFNFRGVGKSSGKSTFNARGEQEDYQAVIRHFEQRFRKIAICGYSYGALIASSIPGNCHVLMSKPHWLTAKSLVFGQTLRDVVDDERSLRIYGGSDWICEKKGCQIQGGDHFWSTGLEEVREILKAWTIKLFNNNESST